MSNSRDERTVVVENASFRLGYLVLSFGLLVDVALRGFAARANEWDLLGLVIVSGLVMTAQQLRHRILGRAWVVATLGAAGIAAALAAALKLLR